MSITRFGFGQYQLTCDICEYMAEAGFLSFEEARAWGRAHGWKVRKEDGEWLNYCLDCAAEAGLTPPLRGNRVSSTTKGPIRQLYGTPLRRMLLIRQYYAAHIPEHRSTKWGRHGQ